MQKFWKDEDGQDFVEYSLLMGFIALAVVGIMTSARTSMLTVWNDINDTLSDAIQAIS